MGVKGRRPGEPCIPCGNDRGMCRAALASRAPEGRAGGSPEPRAPGGRCPARGRRSQCRVTITGLRLAILILVSVVGGGMVMAQRRRELSAAPRQPMLPAGNGDADRQLGRTVTELRPGDVLT